MVAEQVGVASVVALAEPAPDLSIPAPGAVETSVEAPTNDGEEGADLADAGAPATPIFHLPPLSA